MTRRERGFTLLIVLWMLGFLAQRATQFIAVGRAGTSLACNLRVIAMIEAATSGAVQQAVFCMLQPGLADWQAGGGPYRVRIGARQVTLSIADEGTRLNLNLADQPALAALLAQVGHESEHGSGGRRDDSGVAHRRHHAAAGRRQGTAVSRRRACVRAAERAVSRHRRARSGAWHDVRVAGAATPAPNGIHRFRTFRRVQRSDRRARWQRPHRRAGRRPAETWAASPWPASPPRDAGRTMSRSRCTQSSG